MVDPVQLSTSVTGEGPLVVLLHEVTENRHSWDPVVPLLAERFQVIAVDLRGHGESPHGSSYTLDDHVADLRAALQECAPDTRPIVVGHGYGGLVAADYASWHPVAAVVVMDQHLSWAWSPEVVTGLPDNPTMEQIDLAVVHPSGYGPLPDSERDRIRSLRQIDMDVLNQIWEPLRFTNRDRQAWADQTIAFPPGVPLATVLGADPGKRYADWLRGHTRGPVRVEGWASGHYPHLAEPERFVEFVASAQSTPPKKSRWAELFH